MLTFIITIALVGLVVWGITHFIPMPPKFATAIQVIAGVVLLLYVLQFFGLWKGHLPGLLR